jgi:PIN domain nuclease of toxin-antitoxin system
VTVLLDTHFLIWIVLGSRRLREFPWLERYRPWGVSPVSFGRAEVRNPEFVRAVLADRRFLVDEVPLLALVRHALPMEWTRDPFDRLLCAHSRARRVSLCTADLRVRAHHPLLPPELALK